MEEDKESGLGYCFAVHNLCYVGLVILQICTMIQITIGLRRSYDGTHTEAINQARKYLAILYAGCLFVFLLTVCFEALNQTNTFGLDEYGLQLFYFILTPILFITYYISLYMLKNYMNTKENVALLPE